MKMGTAPFCPLEEGDARMVTAKVQGFRISVNGDQPPFPLV